MAADDEQKKTSDWKETISKYTWSITKNDLLDYLPDNFIACEDVRDNFYACADRVGLMRCSTMCSKYLEDYKECRYGYKKWKRLRAIAEQRYLQNRPPIKDIPRDHVKSTNKWNTDEM